MEIKAADRVRNCAIPKPRRDFRINNARPRIRKFNAVAIAILPGGDVPPAKSLNRSWSMPKFQLKRYSLSVSRPINADVDANICAMRSGLLPTPEPVNSSSDNPLRIKARAVLAFIVARPVNMLFRAVLFVSQPTSTRAPIKIAIAPAIFEIVLNNAIRRRFDAESDFELRIILTQAEKALRLMENKTTL
jgi:hypothetical protein